MVTAAFHVARGICRYSCSLRGYDRGAGFLQSVNSITSRDFSSKKMALPRVFFDMTADGQNLGRIVVEVRIQMHYFSRMKCRAFIIWTCHFF